MRSFRTRSSETLRLGGPLPQNGPFLGQRDVAIAVACAGFDLRVLEPFVPAGDHHPVGAHVHRALPLALVVVSALPIRDTSNTPIVEMRVVISGTYCGDPDAPAYRIAGQQVIGPDAETLLPIERANLVTMKRIEG